MIVKLRYTNSLDIRVMVRTNVGSQQPLEPRQALEMTFDLDPGADGVADLAIVCEENPNAS